MDSKFVVALYAGVVLAIPYVAYARTQRGRPKMFAVGLGVAALIYTILAAWRGTSADLLNESGGLLLFGVLAIFGTRFSPYFLAVGWAAHVGWDLLLHPVASSSYAPWWYPVMCIGFDLIVAGAILAAPGKSSRITEA